MELKYVEDTKECHSTCAYEAQPRFANGNKCASCQNGCFDCSSLTACHECTYTKKRISGSVTTDNFITKSVDGEIDVSTDCTEGKFFFKIKC